jgi:hypothetical protein
MVKLSQADTMSREHRFSAARKRARAHSGGIARQIHFPFALSKLDQVADGLGFRWNVLLFAAREKHPSARISSIKASSARSLYSITRPR